MLWKKRPQMKKITKSTKGKAKVISLYGVLHAYTYLIIMTSVHKHLKQFSFTAFCRMGDSPRFAVLPQYTESTESFSNSLSKSLVSQQIAQHDVCMRRPKRYLRLTLAAKEGGLPQAGSCSLNSKYLLLTFLLIKHSQS